MATLVFDIETIGDPFESFDAYTQSQLVASATRRGEDAVSTLALSPLTGSIISLAMYDLERKRGAVYFVGKIPTIDSKADFVVKERTEQELLEDFWEGALSYDTFVTFNGRAFDMPFLIHRSLMCGITPTFTLNQSRYVSKQTLPYHVDLMDEFSFYGAMSKRPSLHLLCLAYGVGSKKGEVDGSQVAELFRSGRFDDLINHNIADVVATTTLYELWRRHLAPTSFLNATQI